MSTIKVNNIDPRNTGETVSVNGLAMPNAGTLGNRSKIINGDMRIAQRGTAAVTATGAYPVDRFRQLVSFTNSAVTFQQETTDVPAGFDYAIKGTVTTADSAPGADQRWSVDQKIEGYNVADLQFGTANAKSVTLSFWVKSSVAGVFCVSLLGAGSRGYVNEYTISSANTWEYKTITVPGDTSGTWDITTNTGLQVFFSLTGGSNLQGTAGSWQNVQKECTSNQTQLLQTLNATWLVSGVQLETGTNATPFEYRSYGDELSRCERYFQKSYQSTTAPGGATANGAYVSRDGAASTVSRYYPVQLQERMRSTPTVVTYDIAGNSNKIRLDSTDNQVSGVSSTADAGFMVFANQTNPSHFGALFQWTAEAEL